MPIFVKIATPRLHGFLRWWNSAASFILETGQLFVKGLYAAVDRAVADFEPEFAGEADAEVVRRIVTNAVRNEMAYRTGKAVVYALAKRANEDWSESDMTTAVTKESLSIAADDYLEGLPRLRRRVREAIKLEKVAA